MSLFSWIDKLSWENDGINFDFYDFFLRIFNAAKWSWQQRSQLTFLWVTITSLILLIWWLYGYKIYRRKRIQNRWRKRMGYKYTFLDFIRAFWVIIKIRFFERKR